MFGVTEHQELSLKQHINNLALTPPFNRFRLQRFNPLSRSRARPSISLGLPCTRELHRPPHRRIHHYYHILSDLRGMLFHFQRTSESALCQVPHGTSRPRAVRRCEFPQSGKCLDHRDSAHTGISPSQTGNASAGSGIVTHV